jgi:hypothetical protein
LGKEGQVWPGIELDIQEDSSRGHLLVIVSPELAKEFSEAVARLTKNLTSDNFIATIDKVIEAFDAFNPLYIAHYKQKKPNLSDDTLKKLETTTKNPGCVIKEVTNSISAGIYISHGHASIYGSDVHDWAKYEELSRELPDLRLPVDSFEHFCLLLKKDPATINTVLGKKTSEDLVLLPFDDGSILKIKAFNDINVVFGPKGTGKSCILKAIAKHYADNGVDASVYESAADRLDEIFDTRGKNLTINLNDYEINYCNNEIKELRAAGEVGITSIAKFVAHFAAKNTNQNAKKILLKNIDPEEESEARREFENFNEAVGTMKVFLEFLAENLSVKKELNPEEQSQVTGILSELLNRLSKREWVTFSEWKEIYFMNSAIKTFRSEVERKTGSAAKPTTTGFCAYAMNRIKIEVNAAEIVKCVETEIPMLKESVGSLGSNKGELEFRTEFKFQSGYVTDSSLSSLSGAKKGAKKQFINCVRKILEHVYADDLFQHISERLRPAVRRTGK